MARPDSMVYRAKKFIGRNKAAAGLSAALSGSLIIGIFATAWQARIAGAQREKAEQRFNDVRVLANSFIFEINEKINDSPIKARELLVKRAIQYLDKLATEDESDISLQSELASSYQKIGDVQADYFGSGIGDTGGALESTEKALKIREQLVLVDPDNVQHNLNLAGSYLKIADLSVTLGRTTKALENYDMAVSVIEKAREKFPQDIDVKRELARAYAKQGQGVLRSGLLAKTLECYEKSLQIAKDLAAEMPENLKLQHSLSVYHSYTGFVKSEMGYPEEALIHFAESQKIDNEILQSDVQSIEFQRNMSTANLWMGYSLKQLKRFPESRKNFETAIEIQQKIYDIDKSNLGDVNSMADCFMEFGWMLFENGEFDVATVNLEKALVFYKNVAKVDVDNLSVIRQIAFTNMLLARIKSKQGNIKSAVEIYQMTLSQLEILNEKETKNLIFRHDQALCLIWLAETQKIITQTKAANENLIKAIQLLEDLVSKSPEHKKRNFDLQAARHLLANLS